MGGALAHNFRPRDTSCLQYLTGLTGRIESFNFRATADNHLNNQQYLKQSLPSFDSINDQQNLLLQVLSVHKTGETKQGNLCKKTPMAVIFHRHPAKQEGIKHSWARTPRILKARGGVYYIKFVRYYNGIRRLGEGCS